MKTYHFLLLSTLFVLSSLLLPGSAFASHDDDDNPLLPDVNPPEEVEASDGEFENKIKIRWEHPDDGDDPDFYRLYRTLDPNDDPCKQSNLYATYIPSSHKSFNDFEVSAGLLYWYSMDSVNNDEKSICSNINFGFIEEPGIALPPENIDASDGTFSDKVRVVWDIPSGGEEITHFRLFRSLSSTNNRCREDDLLEDSISKNTSSFDDTSAAPGVMYFYSMHSVADDGGTFSICSSIDFGFAGNLGDTPLPPSNIEASDEIEGDQIEITWQHPTEGGSIERYRLYRSTSSTGNACQSADLIASEIAPTDTSFTDTVTADIRYYYSMDSIGEAGDGHSSICSNINFGSAGGLPDAPNPPKGIEASDDLPLKIRIDWDAPTQGGPLTSYNLFRAKFPESSQCGDGGSSDTLVAAGITATEIEDLTVTPGQYYRYSLNADGPGGTSACQGEQLPGMAEFPTVNISGVVEVNGSPISGVLISDGTRSAFTDENGEFVLEDVPFGSFTLTAEKTGYEFEPGSFSNPLEINQDQDLNGIDFTGECATGFIFLDGVCISGDGLPSAPQNLQASSDLASGVVLTWLPAENTETYTIYRSQFEGELGAPIAEGISDTTYADTSAVPGVTYYYTVQGVNENGAGELSNTASGVRGTEGSEDDCDGDGVSDEQEIIDGTVVCDPGSFQLHLKSPAYTKYNTFLEQINFLELTASGTQTVTAIVSAYNLDGSLLAQQNVSIAPLSQIDVDINSLVGRNDVYGVIRIDFNAQTPGATLIGRMTNYRRNEDGNTHSFVFTRELRNPTRGPTYSTGNSIDPQGRGYLVPNWAEIINLDTVEQTFIYNLYHQTGQLADSQTIILAPLAEFDVQAGHEIGDGVYTAEVRPLDGAAPYIAAVTRYSSNAAPGETPKTYNFAIPLEARSGNGSAQYVNISNQLGGCWSQTNWIEVVNVREKIVTANIDFRNAAGQSIAVDEISLSPMEQFHFNASAFVEKGAIGSAKITASDPAALVTQSAIYFHDCETDLLQTGYASIGRIPGRDVVAGTFNTFLQTQNLLSVIGAESDAAEFDLELRAGGTQIFGDTNSLLGTESISFNLSEQQVFATTEDSNGTVTIRTTDPSAILAENLRLREVEENGQTRVDFAIPTVLQ